MAEKGSGCFTFVMGAGILCTLPGVIWERLTIEPAPRAQEARERPREAKGVRRVVLPPEAILGPSVRVEEWEAEVWVREEKVETYQEAVKRRVRESAPWIR